MTPRANPQPMDLGDPFDYEEARQAMKASALYIRAAEQEVDEQIAKAADAEGDYRKALRSKIIKLRAEGTGATLAETLARGDDEVVAYARTRDIEAGMVKLRHEMLEDRRGDRASLHKVVDWSMKVAPTRDVGREFERPIGYAGSS